jgi:CHAD domain-containing protein
MALTALSHPLTPASPLWAWAYETIGERAETMLSHLEGVRLGEDIEAVHDMRVWSRRLVAAMRVYEACFPGRGYRRLLREAKSVTRRLGAVRDLDVLIDHYERLSERAPADRQAGIHYLLALLRRERGRARPPMLEALDSTVATHFAERVRRFLRQEAEAYAVGLGADVVRGTPVSNGRRRLHGEMPFRDAAPLALEERYHEFYGFRPYVDNPEAVEELHEMRIKAKWLRYTMELFAPAYADGLKKPLAGIKKFQELLGDLHDSDVRLDRLREALSHPLDPRGLEALGLLLSEPVTASLALLEADERVTRRAHYDAFHAEWQKLERRNFAGLALERLRTPDAPVSEQFAPAGTPAG